MKGIRDRLHAGLMASYNRHPKHAGLSELRFAKAYARDMALTNVDLLNQALASELDNTLLVCLVALFRTHTELTS